ncbi:recombinase family protein [Vibrio sp. S11_S32]|nr:recombinase family protein [Vibrio sp. S11_S32]
MNYAYLRVSTDSQDVANQKHGIYEYSNRVGIVNLVFIEDIITGKKKWRERQLDKLIDGMGQDVQSVKQSSLRKSS